MVATMMDGISKVSLVQFIPKKKTLFRRGYQQR